MGRFYSVAFIFFVSLLEIKSDEVIEVTCHVNGKKALQCVSDKFLSISIDPAVLLAGVNLSENSLLLAQHLSPAYIRVAGSSTKFVHYIDTDAVASPTSNASDTGGLSVTPATWFAVNEWLKLAGLRPVYGLNDVDEENGLWNPKEALKMLELSDQLNVTSLWQLGFDSSNKSELKYKLDLDLLHSIIRGFPEKNDTWKIIASDVSVYPDPEGTIDQLKDILTAAMWEPSNEADSTLPGKQRASRIIQSQKIGGVKLWTTVPKTSGHVTFESALLWAEQLGEAAKVGFDVIFRQPRMYEFFAPTPVFWVSAIHKKLMGTNVLEVKTGASQPGVEIFAHCTRNQNRFIRRGALTLMMVNRNGEELNVKVKFSSPMMDKTMEVQSYILTSPALNSSDVFLNDQLLAPGILSKKEPFEPKLRRAKTPSYISLYVPPMAIAFFVLPGARIPVCIDDEVEASLILEEIEEDQRAPFSEEIALTLGARASFDKHSPLEEITKQIKSEMESDEKYYSNVMKSRVTEPKDESKDDSKEDEELINRRRKFFIDRARLAEKRKKGVGLERRRDGLRQYLLAKSKSTSEEDDSITQMDLTSDEVEKILRDRAKARAAQRNVVFTERELDALVYKAKKKFFGSSRTKRDINSLMLHRIMNSDLIQHKEKREEVKQTTEHVSRVKRNEAESRHLELEARRAQIRQRIEARRQELRERARERREKLLHHAERTRRHVTFKKQGIEELRKTLGLHGERRRRGLYLRKMPNKDFRSRSRFGFGGKSRVRRDINIDMVNELSNGKQKQKIVKEATLRRPDQTSAEILEEFEEEQKMRSEEVESKKELFAELAEADDNDSSGFNPTKKKITDPFGVAVVDDEDNHNKKRKKSKSKGENELQILSASDEFTDIVDDDMCIHEYFGGKKGSVNSVKKSKMELGEYTAENIKASKKQKPGLWEDDETRRKRSIPDEDLRVEGLSKESERKNQDGIVGESSEIVKLELKSKPQVQDVIIEEPPKVEALELDQDAEGVVKEHNIDVRVGEHHSEDVIEQETDVQVGGSSSEGMTHNVEAVDVSKDEKLRRRRREIKSKETPEFKFTFGMPSTELTKHVDRLNRILTQNRLRPVLKRRTDLDQSGEKKDREEERNKRIMMQQLDKLKKKIQRRKNEIDAVLLRETKRDGEEGRSLSVNGLLSQFSKDLGKEIAIAKSLLRSEAPLEDKVKEFHSRLKEIADRNIKLGAMLASRTLLKPKITQADKDDSKQSSRSEEANGLKQSTRMGDAQEDNHEILDGEVSDKTVPLASRMNEVHLDAEAVTEHEETTELEAIVAPYETRFQNSLRNDDTKIATSEFMGHGHDLTEESAEGTMIDQTLDAHSRNARNDHHVHDIGTTEHPQHNGDIETRFLDGLDNLGVVNENDEANSPVQDGTKTIDSDNNQDLLSEAGAQSNTRSTRSNYDAKVDAELDTKIHPSNLEMENIEAHSFDGFDAVPESDQTRIATRISDGTETQENGGHGENVLENAQTNDEDVPESALDLTARASVTTASGSSDDTLVEMRDQQEGPEMRNRRKRAILDLGSHRPLSMNIKKWQPVDVLSLKTNVNAFKTLKAPPNDYYLFKKALASNKIRFSKRSVNFDVHEPNNSIEGYMLKNNEISKKSTFRPSRKFKDLDVLNNAIKKIKYDSGEDNRIDTRMNDILKERDDNFRELERVSQKDEEKNTIAGNNIQKIEGNEKSKVNVEENRGSISNIQKISKSEGGGAKNENDLLSLQDIPFNVVKPKIFERFVSSLSGFLTNVGKQLGVYVKQINI